MRVDADADIEPHALHLQERHLGPHARQRAQVVDRAGHVAAEAVAEDLGGAAQVFGLAAEEADLGDALLDDVVGRVEQRRKAQAVGQARLQLVHGVGRDGVLGL